MPYTVKKKPLKKSKKKWAIIDKDTGKIVGRSVSRYKAQRSAAIRNKLEK